MKLTQIRNPTGNLTAAIVQDGYFRPIPSHTLDSLIRETETSTRGLAELAEEHGAY